MPNVISYDVTPASRHNGFHGFYLLGNPSGQCNGNRLTGCTVSGNAQHGIYLYGSTGECDGNTVADCTVYGNADRGIYLYSVVGNRIEGNHVSGPLGITPYGIRTYSSSQNLILRNTCVGNMTNFSISASDTYGPIVTNAGELATSGAAAHPWANFSR